MAVTTAAVAQHQLRRSRRPAGVLHSVQQPRGFSPGHARVSVSPGSGRAESGPTHKPPCLQSRPHVREVRLLVSVQVVQQSPGPRAALGWSWAGGQTPPPRTGGGCFAPPPPGGSGLAAALHPAAKSSVRASVRFFRAALSFTTALPGAPSLVDLRPPGLGRRRPSGGPARGRCRRRPRRRSAVDADEQRSCRPSSRRRRQPCRGSTPG